MKIPMDLGCVRLTCEMIRGVFFCILMCLRVCAYSVTAPEPFCEQKKCQHSDFLPWSAVADRLHVRFSEQNQCLIQKPNRQATRDSDLWVMRADKWHVRSKVDQASQISGELAFESAEQTLLSDQAWIWRSEDGGMDKLCFPQGARWMHSSWEMALSSVVYQADVDEITACNNAFVLYGKNSQPLYGYAREVFASGKDSLTLKFVSATTCPLDDVAWSVSSDELDWSPKDQSASFKNVKFYFYDIPVFYVPHWRASLGEENHSGWSFPRLASYRGDWFVVSLPYQLSGRDKRELAIDVGLSARNMGVGYVGEHLRPGSKLKYYFRGGLYSGSPTFRYGGVVQYEADRVYNLDTLKIQLQHMRDGWYGQYFSPAFFDSVRPNQDLPSYIHARKRFSGVDFGIDLIQYQKFAGKKVLNDEITIPYLNVLPRFQVSHHEKPLELKLLFENLTANHDKDNYPGVRRVLTYAGCFDKLKSGWEYQLGAWFKSQHVESFQAWPDYSQQHAFIVPNIMLAYRRSPHKKHGLSASYAYTGYVDQAADPVFHKQWQWLSGLWDFDKTLAVDRVYDRNRLWLTYRPPQILNVPVTTEFSHIVDFSKARVSLSANGLEDPLIRYANQVSLLELFSNDHNIMAKGTWVWPLQKFYFYDLHWKYNHVFLRGSYQPDTTLFQNFQVSVPMYHEISASLDVYETTYGKFLMGVDHRRGVDKTFKGMLGFEADQCCWKGKAAIELTHWMSRSTAPQSLFTGLQPSIKLKLSFKGIQSMTKRAR